jgi:hypothetical protein
MALFLRVQVVFRHVGEAVEHAEAPYAVDAYPVSSITSRASAYLRALAGVDPAAGQLQFRPGVFLERGEDAVARVDDGIDAGAGRVALPGKGRASETAVHGSSCCCRPRSCQSRAASRQAESHRVWDAHEQRPTRNPRRGPGGGTRHRRARPEDRGRGRAAAGRGPAEDFGAAVEAILATTGRVILGGIGKSGHIARKISSTLASTGTPSAFVHPAEASHGDLGMIMPGDLVILISNSGETSELRDIVAHVARFSIPLSGFRASPGRP